MNRFAGRDSGLAAFSRDKGVIDDAGKVLEELRREVNRRCPEWTELGAEDPRAVLLEVFAEALAELQKRVDHLEDGLLPRLLEALGEEPRRVLPARGVVQFAAHAEGAEAVRVPRGTVVSASRRRGQPHIAYETTSDAWCSSARLLRVVTTAGSRQRDWIPFPQSGWDRCSGVFPAPRVRPERYLYLGDPVLSALRSEAGQLVLEWPDIAAVREGRHLIEALWECSIAGGWSKVRVEWEQVGGRTPVLRSRIRGPVHDIAEHEVDYLRSAWLRCALPGGIDLRFPTPEWVTSSAAIPETSALGRVAFNFPRPVAKVLTRHEETWRDHSLEGRRPEEPASGVSFEVARCPPEWETAVYLGWERPIGASVYWHFADDRSPVRRAPGDSSARAGSWDARAGSWDDPAAGRRGLRARFDWEYFGTDGFSPLEVEDDTRGFSRSGVVTWGAPPDWTEQELHGEKLYWLRARWTDGGCLEPPRLSAIVPHGVGIRQGRVLQNLIHEVDFDARGRGRLCLSCADGEPQVVEALELEGENGTWVDCQLDSAGTVAGDDRDEQKGPVKSPPSGSTSSASAASRPLTRLRRLPGGVLEIEAGPQWRGLRSVRFPHVRFCHGKEGNLPAGSLRILESELPGVAEVTQPLATTGGTDAESAEDLRRRVLAEWSIAHRIGTTRELRLMCQALVPEVARVEWAVDRDDTSLLQVTVVALERDGGRRLSSDRLRWLEEELQERLPIGTVVDVREPAYVRVEVIARLRRDGPLPLPPPPVRRAIELRLEEFFHPLHGGLDRRGLPAHGWLPREGFASLMSKVLGPRDASRVPASEETTAVLGDWPLEAWRFDLVVPGAVPAAWRETAGGGARIAFPVLERLRFEGDGRET